MLDRKPDLVIDIPTDEDMDDEDGLVEIKIHIPAQPTETPEQLAKLLLADSSESSDEEEEEDEASLKTPAATLTESKNEVEQPSLEPPATIAPLGADGEEESQLSPRTLAVVSPSSEGDEENYLSPKARMNDIEERDILSPDDSVIASPLSSRKFSSSSSPISAIRFLLFTPEPLTPTQQPLTVEIKRADPVLKNFHQELSEMNQTLGHVKVSLTETLQSIVESDLTIQPLKNLQGNVDLNAGNELVSAIARQKKHIDTLRWLPYLPNLVVLLPFIPGLWKIPAGFLMCLFGNQLTKQCFGQYSYNLHKLERVADMQQNLFKKKEKMEYNISNYQNLSTQHHYPMPHFPMYGRTIF